MAPAGCQPPLEMKRPKSIAIGENENGASHEAWRCLEEFLRGFAAAGELHNRAGESGSFVESVCLGASIVDAMLRIGIVLQHQIDRRNTGISIELIYQDEDKASKISEREIYRRALTSSVIDEPTFNQLEKLYSKRNRVIHRYVISRITTSEVLDIAIECEAMIGNIKNIIYSIEQKQIDEGVGITVDGPDLEGEDGRRWVEEFADQKHGPVLATMLRNSLRQKP